MRNKGLIYAFFSTVLFLLLWWFFSEGLLSDMTRVEQGRGRENLQESCLDCHSGTRGYSSFHNPEHIGCTSCHLGNSDRPCNLK